MRKFIIFPCFILLILFLTGLDLEIGRQYSQDNIISQTSFIDDNGILINNENKNVKLVSLSPSHTENLYEIGAKDKLIGVDEQSIYPIEALELTKFRLDKKWDIDQLIKMKPDYVLIEPKQKDSHRKLVATLESNDIVVVSLLPTSMDEFDTYIKKLGILSQHYDDALGRLDQYHKQFDEVIKLIKQGVSTQGRKTIFIETSEKGYYAPDKEHMINLEASLAGGNVLTIKETIFNKAEDNQLKVGKDYIMNHDSVIDTYFTITGSGYLGASLISFAQKEGFKDLKVYKNHQVFDLKSQMVGQYTFSYLEGVKEFHRLMYQDESLIKAFDFEKSDQALTRLSFAQIIYDYYTLPTYVNSDSHYYEFDHFFHIYGAYKDVNYKHPWYHVIETITMKGYLKPIRDNENNEYFDENNLITRDELSMFLVIRMNISIEESIKLLDEVVDVSSTTYKNQDLINILMNIKGEDL